MRSFPTPSLFLALCSLFFLLGSSWSHAATSSINPAADAFVTTGPTGNLNSSNYGGAGAISVAAPGLSQGEFQSLLQFSLSDTKSSFDSQFGAGQWSIQSVTLQLTAAGPNSPIFNAPAAGQFGISWMQNDTWLEGTGTPQFPGSTGITFSSLSGFLGPGDQSLGTFSFNGATSGNSISTLGLASSFTADILAGNNVSIRLFAADSSVSAIFNSRTFNTTAARPVLTITAIPEPSYLALGTLAVCFLVSSRLVRRSK